MLPAWVVMAIHEARVRDLRSGHHVQIHHQLAITRRAVPFAAADLAPRATVRQMIVTQLEGLSNLAESNKDDRLAHLQDLISTHVVDTSGMLSAPRTVLN
jgi:hypothetical protein